MLCVSLPLFLSLAREKAMLGTVSNANPQARKWAFTKNRIYYHCLFVCFLIFVFLKLIYILLKDNCFTEFCCFLWNLNMNQPYVYIYPLSFETIILIMEFMPPDPWENKYLFYFVCLVLVFKVFYWSMVDLQCCVNLRCTAKWISFTCTYIHCFLDSFPI